MATISDLTAILFVFQAIFLVLTTIFVLYTGIKKKMRNIMVLGLGFFFSSSAILGVILGSTFDDMQNVYNLGLVSIAIFVNMTFYREIHSGFRIIISSVVLLYVTKIFSYNVFEEQGIWFYIDTISQTFLVVLPLLYYTIASLRAYNEIKEKRLIPHVRKRLKIMGYVSIFAIIGNLPIWILEIVTGQPYDELPFGSAFVIFLVTITSLVFAIGMFLAWVMPRWFKSYLNRNYDGFVYEEPQEEEEEAEFSESERAELAEMDVEALTSTNEMVIFLAEQLSDISGMSKQSGRGLIRFSVRDHFKEIPKFVQYQEWIEIIETPVKQRLEKFVKDPDHVSNELRKSLIENQSVITMISV